MECDSGGSGSPVSSRIFLSGSSGNSGAYSGSGRCHDDAGSLAVITERALDSQSENYASKLTVAQNLLRKVMFVAALFFFWCVLKIDLLAAVLGAMGMKAGAYLQPLVRKISGYQEEPAKAILEELEEPSETENQKYPGAV